MADRTRGRKKISDEVLDELLAGQDAAEVFRSGTLIDDLKKAVAERALDAEMEAQLEREGEEDAGNHRNGHNRKRVLTDNGAMDLEVPWDRQGRFEPQLVGVVGGASRLRRVPSLARRLAGRCGRAAAAPGPQPRVFRQLEPRVPLPSITPKPRPRGRVSGRPPCQAVRQSRRRVRGHRPAQVSRGWERHAVARPRHYRERRRQAAKRDRFPSVPTGRHWGHSPDWSGELTLNGEPFASEARTSSAHSANRLRLRSSTAGSAFRAAGRTLPAG